MPGQRLRMANSRTLERKAPPVTEKVTTASRGLWNPNTLMRTAFFTTEIVAAALLFTNYAPELQGPLLVLAILLVINVAADLNPIQIYGNTYITVGMVATIAIIVLFGAPGVVFAAPAEALAGAAARRRLDFRAVHNVSMFTIVYCAGAFTYTSLGGDVLPGAMSISLVPAALAATGVAFSLNALFLAVVLNLMAGQSVKASWDRHAWLAPHYMALGFIGLALALSYVSLGIFGIVAFLTPAATLRIAMKQYVDKTKDQVVQLEQQNAALTTANVEVIRMGDELRQSYDGTLEALVNALDARDQETKGHSLRVSKYMMDIARELGVGEGSREWLDMQRGSLLHDVGKIGVSDNILLKPGKLTEDEWKLMRLHPEIGYKMLHQVKFLEGPAEIILAHHERWDGKGYPRGLAQNEIPLGARIFPVVDTFDAMTSDRPYRKALSTQDAQNEILKYSGSQFDPRVVEAFLDIYQKWVTMWAELHEEDEASSWMPRAA
jgi:putative nucleotidyltransferase with HDIG domain